MIGKVVEEFLASFDFAETTKDSYRHVLHLLPVQVETWHAADLICFVSRPSWGSSQRYTALCACRKFIGWYFGSSHPSLQARVKRIQTAPQPRLSGDQIMRLIDSLDPSTEMGRRDLAIIGVALDCNLRAAELCNLELKNVNLDTCKLFAQVKGGQWRWKVFSETTGGYIHSWVGVREAAPGVTNVFISFHHQNRGLPLARSGMQQIMRRWGRRVGFHISPHMFRRSYASLSTLAGAPKNIVKVGGGWKNDQVVDHYIGDLELEVTRPYLPMDNIHGA